MPLIQKSLGTLLRTASGLAGSTACCCDACIGFQSCITAMHGQIATMTTAGVADNGCNECNENANGVISGIVNAGTPMLLIISGVASPPRFLCAFPTGNNNVSSHLELSCSNGTFSGFARTNFNRSSSQPGCSITFTAEEAHAVASSLCGSGTAVIPIEYGVTEYFCLCDAATLTVSV